MTERIDHAAEAREALRGSGDGRNFATDASNNAIAHAVLALVEQQRIANIIALHRHEVEYDLNGGRSLIFESGGETLRPEIAEALGID